MRFFDLFAATSMAGIAAAEVFPLNSQFKPPIVSPYKNGDVVLLECIQRQIDNGEHKFDSEGNIQYSGFPVCQETGEPFALKYGVSEDVNCTIQLDDETYHLFQLYIHEDAPFSCRVPFSKTFKDGYIPLTLNFRGHLESSHLDIDSTMNVIAHKRHDGAIMTTIGYASGDQTQRYIIGDKLTIQFSVQWVEESHPASSASHYKLPLGFSGVSVMAISGFVATVTAALVYALMYGSFNKKLKDFGYHKPGFASTEEGKRD